MYLIAPKLPVGNIYLRGMRKAFSIEDLDRVDKDGLYLEDIAR